MNDLVISLLLLGAVSNGDQLPFWATANQWGLMPDSNGTLTMVEAHTSFDPERTLQWRAGSSLALSTCNPDHRNYDLGTSARHPMVDELYGSLRWKKFTLDVGMKRRELDFWGASGTLGSLSVTGGHIVESGNSRTMPGYNVTLAPVTLPFTRDKLLFYGEFGDYRTLDDRFIDDALVHRTKLALRYDLGDRFRAGIGLDHYALWGGEGPVYGRMAVTPGNYLRVITGSSASSEGTRSDQVNCIGDQGGGEFGRLEYLGRTCNLVFQYEKPYSDKSGMGHANIPDGVYTFSYSRKPKDCWISDVLYEYQYSKCQSGKVHDRPATEEDFRKRPKRVYERDGEYYKVVGGCDNYFTNGQYRSAWTYFGRCIGNPLFFTGYNEGHVIVKDDDGNVIKDEYAPYWSVINNFLLAHHFAVSGKLFRKAPYKLMLTYSSNCGRYGGFFDQHKRQLSAAWMGEIPAGKTGLTLTYGLYADKGSVYEDTMGATLGLRYTLTGFNL